MMISDDSMEASYPAFLHRLDQPPLAFPELREDGMGCETARCYPRRLQQGVFHTHFRASTSMAPEIIGIDIGHGFDILHVPDVPNIRAWGWEIWHGDGTYLEGVPDRSVDFIYNSHVLEHLDESVEAIANWIRVCADGGTVMIAVPHRFYYEKVKVLPSVYNDDHRRLYLPFTNEAPDTVSFYDEVVAGIEASGRRCDIAYMDQDTVGNTNWGNPDEHPNGRVSIEVVIRVGTGAWA